VPPSPELNALIDEAVDVSRTELLAPVLFEYDSVELEPSSVAMLHEVARMLNRERKDIELLAVVAYADNRGSADYNLELSERRALHVRDWLVAHGVAAQRLTTEARGANDPVEVGDEADHQQNRRVIFRVLRAESRP
jgi:OOP family OmpA-OmpF porin